MTDPIPTWPDGVDEIPNRPLVYFDDGIELVEFTRTDPGDRFAPGLNTNAQQNPIPILLSMRGALQKRPVLEPGGPLVRWGVHTRRGQPNYGHFYSRDDRDPLHLTVKILRSTPQSRRTNYGLETWLYFFMLGAERSFCAGLDIRPFALLGYAGQIDPAWCDLNKLEGGKGIWAYHRFFMSGLHIHNTALKDILPGRTIDLVKFAAPPAGLDIAPGVIGGVEIWMN